MSGPLSSIDSLGSGMVYPARSHHITLPSLLLPLQMPTVLAILTLVAWWLLDTFHWSGWIA